MRIIYSTIVSFEFAWCLGTMLATQLHPTWFKYIYDWLAGIDANYRWTICTPYIPTTAWLVRRLLLPSDSRRTLKEWPKYSSLQAAAQAAIVWAFTGTLMSFIGLFPPQAMPHHWAGALTIAGVGAALWSCWSVYQAELYISSELAIDSAAITPDK